MYNIYSLNGTKIVNNPLENTIITAIGDSFVRNSLPLTDQWPYLIANRNGAESVNMGVGGETLRTMVQSERYKNINSNSSYIIVFTGANDVHYDYTPLGSITDESNTTFYGCLNILCRDLMNLYPTAKILFITPTHRTDLYDYKPYVNAIKEVCYKYSLPVWDAYGESGILLGNVNGVTAQSAIYELSPLHLNKAGNEYISYKIEAILKML